MLAVIQNSLQKHKAVDNIAEMRVVALVYFKCILSKKIYTKFPNKLLRQNTCSLQGLKRLVSTGFAEGANFHTCLIASVYDTFTFLRLHIKVSTKKYIFFNTAL